MVTVPDPTSHRRITAAPALPLPSKAPGLLPLPHKEAQLIMTAPTNSDAPLLLTVEEASARMNIGRTLMYSLVLSGAVRSVKVGGRLRRVPTEALSEYIAAQLVGDVLTAVAA